MAKFACPVCGKDRLSEDAACDDCGWGQPKEKKRDKPTCLACGHNLFEWGYVFGTQRVTLHFSTQPPSLFDFNYEEVKARRCRGCGNIQLFSG